MTELTEEQKKVLEEQKAQCPFCRIVAGDIPATKVYEDDQIIAILDINPAVKGHILVMPKEHYPIMAMLPPELFKHIFSTVPELAKSLEEALILEGTQVFIASGGAAGQNVGHFMLHLIPREGGDGLDKFSIEHKELPEDKFEEVKKIVSNNLNVIMQKRLGKTPSKFTKEQVLQIIEQNPQIKELIVKDPSGFKEAVPQNPQLQSLFKDVNVDEVIEAFTGKKLVAEDKEEEKKEESKEEESKEEQESTDNKDDDNEGDEPEDLEEKDGDADEEKDDEVEEKEEKDTKDSTEDIDFDKISEMLK